MNDAGEDREDRTEIATTMPTPRSDAPPDRLGRYRLERLLAQGGMAEVYVAHPEGALGKHVVIKRIRPSLLKAQNDKMVEMFLREAQLLATMRHPNIVQVLELGKEPRRDGGVEHFIVMEMLVGLTLRDLADRMWSAKQPLPVEVIVRVIADACLGLDHAHRLPDAQGRPAQLVHRDLSPDNLFVTTTGTTKVLDFGVAKRQDWNGLTTAGELKGKVPYMSPEQLRGQTLDARSDIFSIGVVLYWLLCGRRPFDGPSEVWTMKMILEDAPEPLRKHNARVPALLEQVVMSCLEKDRDKRIPTAVALRDALEMLLVGLPQAGIPRVDAVVRGAMLLKGIGHELSPDVAAVTSVPWEAPAPPPTQPRKPMPRTEDTDVERTIAASVDDERTVVGAGPSNLPTKPVAAPHKPGAPISMSEAPADDDAPTMREGLLAVPSPPTAPPTAPPPPPGAAPHAAVTAPARTAPAPAGLAAPPPTNSGAQAVASGPPPPPAGLVTSSPPARPDAPPQAAESFALPNTAPQPPAPLPPPVETAPAATSTGTPVIPIAVGILTALVLAVAAVFVLGIGR